MTSRSLSLAGGVFALALAAGGALILPAAGAGGEAEIVRLLPRDAIPAIDDPRFVGVKEAEAWMDAEEPVIGLSLGGDRRAYSVRMLSSHEIVNDVVGGRKVAITW